MADLTVKFTDVAGYYYTATVSNLSSSLSLTAASSPFVIEEDNSDDPMTPLRISSGYLTVKTDSNTYLDRIIPTTSYNRRVELTRATSSLGVGSVVWAGYVQAKAFDNTFLRSGDDVQIPIHSQLASLACIHPSHDWNDTPTFADVIRQMLTANGFNSFSNVYFATSTSFKTNLLMRFCWSNLFDMNSDGEPEDKYNCLQILEEICKFWGLTLREQGDNLIFQSVDEPYDEKVTYMTWDNFVSFCLGQSYTSGETDYLSNSISSYYGMDQSVSVIQGVSKAVIESTPNTVSSVMSLDCQDLMEKWKARPVSKSGNDTDGYYFRLRGTYDYSYPSDTVVEYENWTATLHETGDQDRETLAQINYCQFNAFEIYKGKLEYKRNYDFEYWLELEGACTSKYLLQAQSKAPIAFANCLLVVDADVMYFSQNVKDIRDADYIILECQLRIGQLYWNGSSWTGTSSTFKIECGYDDDTSTGVGKIKCTRTLSSTAESYTGHDIGIPTAQCGIVTFRIIKAYRDIEGTISWRPIFLKNLRLSVANPLNSTVKTARDKNRYFDWIGTFEQDYEINTIFATSNNNEWGTGLILTNGRAVATGANFYFSGDQSSFVAPERELLRRIQSFRSTPRHVYDLTLNYNSYSLCNWYDDFYISSISRTCNMLSCSIDFSENQLKVKLIEKK